MHSKQAYLFLNLLSVILCAKIDISLIGTNSGIKLTATKGTEVKLLGTLAVGRNVASSDCIGKPSCQIGDVTLTLEKNQNGCTITWTSNNTQEVMKDCFDLKIGNWHWYGGPERYFQPWPLEKLTVNGSQPYVIKKSDNNAVAERYWLNSKGAFIFVDDRVPLFIDQNMEQHGKVCFIAKAVNPYINRKRVLLQYDIGIEDDPKQAHLYAVNTFLGKPKSLPNKNMIKEPTWTTWPKYKKYINQNTVIEFVESIKKHGFGGQIEIDEDWETCFGSHVFKPDKFGNITNIVKEFKKQGFRVTLWINPFVNNNCENYSTIGKQKGYFVKNPKGETKAIWWESNDAHQIDFTNPAAAKWFSDRIRVLLNNPGVDGFKFDAGETDYAIPPSQYDGVDQEQVPNILTKHYVKTCNEFGNLTEVRSAWRTQEYPIFLRMIDKESSWNEWNGLYTLVTTLLQLNMNGYGFVLPDMIGGNGYGRKPTSELIVRWTQANALMPAMQFGYLPWDYLNNTFNIVGIVRNFIKLHETYTDKIIAAMQANIQNGTPVNPPIWWIDPTDSKALATDDEFLLGEDVLVAPLLMENARKRDIYLPQGTWKDGNTGTIYKGPTTLTNHPVPIEMLPFFVKQT